MKLNETSPEQHKAILVLAGVLIFINCLDAAKSYFNEETGPDGQPLQRYTQSIDGATGAVTRTETRYNNPELSWYEKLLCRGYQRSSRCTLKLMHPKTADADEYGIELPEGAPRNDHVVYFRGNINKNTAFSQNIEIPNALGPRSPMLEADATATEPVVSEQAPNPDFADLDEEEGAE